MEEVKSPFKSVTIWSSFFILLFNAIALLKLVGIDVPELTQEDAQFFAEKTVLLITNGAAIVAALGAIWGRIRAKAKIKV